MKVVGITGGVGSGKSEVLRLLEEKFECKVIRTDDVARDLCEPGQVSYRRIVDAFGTGVLDAEGRLDRPKMAAMVFGDNEKLQLLNECTHPDVYAWVREHVREWKTDGSCRMIAVEAALMEELKMMGVCDSYWFIYVKPEIRRERLRISRGYSEEKMDAVFASQLDESVFINGCDVLIDNNSDLESVEKQLKSLCKSQ